MRLYLRLLALVAVSAAGCGKKVPIESPVAEVDQESQAFEPNAPLADKVALAIDKLEAGGPDDLALAVAILEQSLPEDREGATELNLGIALQRTGKLEAAMQHYKAVLRAHPEWDEAWVYFGAAQERLGDPGQAMRTFVDAIAENPENMGARIGLVAVLRSLGRPDEAIEAAKAALKVNSNALGIYNTFALAYLDKGDTTLARFILQKALQGVEGAQTNAYLHTNLGWSYYLDGNKPAAVQSLKQAVELEPELVPALVYLATVYLEDRNYEDMIPLLETALENDPQNADVLLNLGIAYRGMQRFDDAKRAYATALELDPRSPEPWFNLGILLGDSLKDYEASLDAFAEYVDGGGADTERAAAYILAVTKERETAERRRKAEEARKQRENERLREQERLRAAEAAAAEAPGGEGSEGGVESPEGSAAAERPADETLEVTP